MRPVDFLIGESVPPPEIAFVREPGVSGDNYAYGPTAGGTLVEIYGTNLLDALSITFGGVAGTITYVDPSGALLRATIPANTAGLKAVAVTTPGGTHTLSNAFTYVAPAALSLRWFVSERGQQGSSTWNDRSGGYGGAYNQGVGQAWASGLSRAITLNVVDAFGRNVIGGTNIDSRGSGWVNGAQPAAHGQEAANGVVPTHFPWLGTLGSGGGMGVFKDGGGGDDHPNKYPGTGGGYGGHPDGDYDGRAATSYSSGGGGCGASGYDGNYVNGTGGQGRVGVLVMSYQAGTGWATGGQQKHYRDGWVTHLFDANGQSFAVS